MTTHHTDREEKIMIFIAINAVVQFIADVTVEALHIIPTRINHISLTLLNAFLSWKTLSAIHKDRFRFLHEDVQALFMLEVLLIFGDVFYLIDDWDWKFVYVRLAFVALSVFNLGYITKIIIKYDLYHITYQGSCDTYAENLEKVEKIDIAVQ